MKSFRLCNRCPSQRFVATIRPITDREDIRHIEFIVAGCSVGAQASDCKRDRLRVRSPLEDISEEISRTGVEFGEKWRLVF